MYIHCLLKNSAFFRDFGADFHIKCPNWPQKCGKNKQKPPKAAKYRQKTIKKWDF